ncbi:hypothetical protein [Helicobacter cappadocius]|uniref:Uncharacterized protein n=1 Tax=Helicobacter cappadocius TaxID=3063998 RepID=A0AA90PT94_9HELI|nr:MULTISPECIES: hypothetical protein [unclassified Helicobacter]MDO7252463.1 hypothetical protein [Helicobacter sp. faydin-H75]MDP2538330.1 hypothetical protein [Helicobacter sp. faydin-H76]
MRVNISSIKTQSGHLTDVASSLADINNKEAFVIKINLKNNNHSVIAFRTLAKYSLCYAKKS